MNDVTFNQQFNDYVAECYQEMYTGKKYQKAMEVVEEYIELTEDGEGWELFSTLEEAFADYKLFLANAYPKMRADLGK